MSDTTILTASVKVTLEEIAKQAEGLGTGLLNAAPGDKSGVPNNSIQYLLGIATSIQKVAEDCEKLIE